MKSLLCIFLGKNALLGLFLPDDDRVQARDDDSGGDSDSSDDSDSDGDSSGDSSSDSDDSTRDFRDTVVIDDWVWSGDALQRPEEHCHWSRIARGMSSKLCVVPRWCGCGGHDCEEGITLVPEDDANDTYLKRRMATKPGRYVEAARSPGPHTIASLLRDVGCLVQAGMWRWEHGDDASRRGVTLAAVELLADFQGLWQVDVSNVVQCCTRPALAAVQDLLLLCHAHVDDNMDDNQCRDGEGHAFQPSCTKGGLLMPFGFVMQHEEDAGVHDADWGFDTAVLQVYVPSFTAALVTILDQLVPAAMAATDMAGGGSAGAGAGAGAGIGTGIGDSRQRVEGGRLPTVCLVHDVAVAAERWFGGSLVARNLHEAAEVVRALVRALVRVAEWGSRNAVASLPSVPPRTPSLERELKPHVLHLRCVHAVWVVVGRAVWALLRGGTLKRAPHTELAVKPIEGATMGAAVVAAVDTLFDSYEAFVPVPEVTLRPRGAGVSPMFCTMSALLRTLVPGTPFMYYETS